MNRFERAAIISSFKWQRFLERQRTSDLRRGLWWRRFISDEAVIDRFYRRCHATFWVLLKQSYRGPWAFFMSTFVTKRSQAPTFRIKLAQTYAACGP